jgi:hypothetical protein
MEGPHIISRAPSGEEWPVRVEDMQAPDFVEHPEMVCYANEQQIWQLDQFLAEQEEERAKGTKPVHL